jgi:hypothetical protein
MSAVGRLRLGRARLVVIASVGIVAILGGVGAYAAIGSSGSSPTGQQIAAAGPGPGRLVRAYGFDAATATAVSTLRNGDSVSVLLDDEARCLLRMRENRIVGEACADDADLGSGRGVSVTDECGSASAHLMEITGLAPEAVTAVRLEHSDGSSEVAPVESGTFKFEGTNPVSGAAYPTGLEWMTGAATVGKANLPVAGDEFCLPAESQTPR